MASPAPPGPGPHASSGPPPISPAIASAYSRSSAPGTPTTPSAPSGAGLGALGATASVAGPMASSSSSSSSAPTSVALTFDEAAIRALCASDVAQPLLSDWVGQSCGSVQHLASFLRKRAAIEEEYARSMTKLARSSAEMYTEARAPSSASSSLQGFAHHHGAVRAGSYVQAWQGILSSHTSIAEGRQRFASLLQSVADEASTLAKEADRQRRSTRDAGARAERTLLDADAARDKARQRFDQLAEELERVLLMKNGETRNSDLAVMAHQNAAAAEEARATSPESPPATNTTNKRGGKRLNRAVGAMGKAFNKPRGAAQLLRAEEDVRLRTSQASDSFRRESMAADQVRNEYFSAQYPRLVRQLKDTADEIDAGAAYHLARYALLYENALLADAKAIAPMGSPPATKASVPNGNTLGLKDLLRQIDNRSDFTSFMQNWQVAHGATYRGPRREHIGASPTRETIPSSTSTSAAQTLPRTTASPAAQTSIVVDPSCNSNASYPERRGSAPGTPSRPSVAPETDPSYGLPPSQPGQRRVFGVDLTEQLERDSVAVPPVLVLCAEAVEAVALDTRGIYRISGIASRVQRLKKRFDDDWTRVNLFDPIPPDPNEPDAPGTGEPEDINTVSSCLKLWLRELPEPLLTFGLYEEFIEGSKITDSFQRQVRLHSLINELPDANYSTLKALMHHLSVIRSHESSNQMGLQNLGIVFGPTLLSAPVPRNLPTAQVERERERDQINFRDMGAQCKVIETILDKYAAIFVIDEDGEEPQEE